MVMKIRNKFVTAGAGVIAVAGMVLGGATAAQAVYDTVALTPAPVVDSFGDLYYDAGTPVALESNGRDSSVDYTVALCTTAGIPPTGAPACSDSIPYSVNGSGVLTASYTVGYNIPNAHKNLPNQPETFNCGDPESCEFVVSEHDGQSGTVVDDSVNFYIN